MARKTKDQDDPPRRFEEILGQLEVLVERLESGDLSLEDSLEAYEQGIKLTRSGGEKLDQAERRLEVLTAQGVVGHEAGEATE